MRVRKGNSKDLSENKRRHIFDTYQKHKEDLAQIEISRMLGYNQGVSLCLMKKSKWWAELEAEMLGE